MEGAQVSLLSAAVFLSQLGFVAACGEGTGVAAKIVPVPP